MNIHEYQAKNLFKEYAIAIPKGEVVTDAQEAVKAARDMGGNLWVVKAQIHAGGRGKAGGVKIARTLNEVETHARDILGKKLVTYQTDSGGKEVKTLLIEEGLEIEQEYYVGVVLDRNEGRIAFMASSQGGVDIESIAHSAPDKIIKAHIDPASGLTPFVGRKLAYGVGLSEKKIVGVVTDFFEKLYRLYMEKDCSIVEVNPLVKTKNSDILALDAKINFDENALWKHPEIEKLRDLTQESMKELEAKNHGLSYIELDGNIGCLVNGAGLAMATMDIIKLYGGNPANFLDVGGGASKEAVQKAFSIILSDKKVRGILVNIFGGIMRCDVMAEGIVAASKELGVKVPLVVRLEGTNVALGKKILNESGLKITASDNLADAAKKVTQAVGSEI